MDTIHFMGECLDKVTLSAKRFNTVTELEAAINRFYRTNGSLESTVHTCEAILNSLIQSKQVTTMIVDMEQFSEQEGITYGNELGHN